MKRYRVFPFYDFDTRARTLTRQINDEWDKKVKEGHYENRKKVTEHLIAEFGELEGDAKIENFIALDAKPPSIPWFHNLFFNQIRNAFVIGAYYPALTGACALGERILNYLMLILREDFKGTPEYKRIYQKNSFYDWDILIKTLKSWEVLLPDVVENFYRLKEIRNKAIHFQPETEGNDRDLALEAINCMKAIIGDQFSSFGSQPWFITGIPGEVYIKSSWKKKPFISKIYLPNCILVGYKHEILSFMPKVMINDKFKYSDLQITDDEFCRLRTEREKSA
jgi:hypothetical protein